MFNIYYIFSKRLSEYNPIRSELSKTINFINGSSNTTADTSADISTQGKLAESTMTPPEDSPNNSSALFSRIALVIGFAVGGVADAVITHLCTRSKRRNI